MKCEDSNKMMLLKTVSIRLDPMEDIQIYCYGMHKVRGRGSGPCRYRVESLCADGKVQRRDIEYFVVNRPIEPENVSEKLCARSAHMHELSLLLVGK